MKFFRFGTCRAYQRNLGARGKFLFWAPIGGKKNFPDIKKRVKKFYFANLGPPLSCGPGANCPPPPSERPWGHG